MKQNSMKPFFINGMEHLFRKMLCSIDPLYKVRQESKYDGKHGSFLIVSKDEQDISILYMSKFWNLVNKNQHPPLDSNVVLEKMFAEMSANLF